jgi:putative transposase
MLDRLARPLEWRPGMGRPTRVLPDNVPQHIVNRGNRKTQIFRCDEDYIGFLGGMVEAGEHTVVRVIDFCLMPNHWHLVLWPYRGDEISTYMQILMNSHLRDLLPRHNLAGLGHVYQGRYRNFPIVNEQHFLNVCRYVASNALRANLCERAQDWPWSSLACAGPAPEINLLSAWPIPKPRDWLAQVNASRVVLPLPQPQGWLAPSEAAAGDGSCLYRRNRDFIDIV